MRDKWSEIDYYLNNLNMLKQTQPEFSSLIEKSHPLSLLPSKSGLPTYRITLQGETRWLHSKYNPATEADSIISKLKPEKASILFIGIGLGYSVISAAKQFKESVFLVLEPNLSMVRTMLSLFDFSSLFSDKRLFFLTGDKDPIEILELINKKTVKIYHPVLAKDYKDYLRNIRYDIKVKKSKNSVILFDYKLFAKDIADLFEKSGIAVRVIDGNNIDVRKFRVLCKQINPEFLFSVNFSPQIAFLATIVKVPYISWTIDPLPENRFIIHNGTNLDLCMAFVHQRHLMNKLSECGLSNVSFLPLAAPLERRKPVNEIKLLKPYMCNISFVGGTLNSERMIYLQFLNSLGAKSDFIDKLDDFIISYYKKYADNAENTGFSDNINCYPDWFTGFFNRCENINTVYEALNSELSRILRGYRIRSCNKLKIEVYGDEGWSDFSDNYRGLADHNDELTYIYNASLINLDIPRVYQRDILTMRVFDILLCGKCLLTEYNEEILSLFSDNEHLITYKNTSDLIQKATSLFKQPEFCNELGLNGMKKVLNNHLLTHRVNYIIEKIKDKNWIKG